jgi:AraC family transcriptional regulator
VTVAKVGPSTSTQHWARIGQARAFIRTHAAEPLTLDRIAGEAAVSPFHFARMFRALTGETIFHCVTRLRLRAAADMLLARTDRPVTEIAIAVGYDAASSFNKAFKKTFGTSPTHFRALSGVTSASLLARVEDPDMHSRDAIDLETRPEFRQRPERRFFFVRRRGTCTDEAPRAWAEFHRLTASARLHGPDVEFVGASYDDAGAVAEKSHFYEAGVTVPARMPTPPGLTRGTLPSGHYAVFRYRGPYSGIGRAFDTLFRGWVVDAGATFRSAPCLEIYLNDPRTVPPAALLTELCIPVEERR